MRLIDTELYDLAIALADSAARSDIECLCVRTGDDKRTYCDVGARNDADDVSAIKIAWRYLELREASGEPMPYQIERKGDNIRFVDP